MDSYTLTPEEKAYVAGSDISALPASLEIQAAVRRLIGRGGAGGGWRKRWGMS